MTRSKRKVFWLPNIYIRSCLHFPFLFLTYEVAHRHGHPPTYTRGCVPRYTCLTHAGSMCMGTHPHTPRTAVPLGCIYFPSQAWVFVLHTKESTFGFLQKNPEIRIQVQGIYWGGVIWKIPLWKWSREAETVRNVVNPQWWLWSTGTQLPWGVLGETVEPENYLWIISPQRGGRWNLYPKSTPFLSWLWLMEKEKCQLPYWRVQRAGAGHSQAKKRAHPSSRKRLQCQLSSSLFDPWKNSFLLSEPQFPSAVTWLPTRLVWGFWHWQPSAWPPKRDGFSVSPPELLVPFQPLLVRVAQGLLSGSPSSLGHSLWVILSNLQTLNSI